MKLILSLMLMTGAVSAAECNSIEQDKALVQKQGLADYLGVTVLPFTDGVSVLYRLRSNNFTVFSPVIDGCVSRQTFVLGPFKARIGV